MTFISTRGQAAPKPRFADVLLAAWRPTAGFICREAWPQFSAQRDRGLQGKRYQDVGLRHPVHASPATPSREPNCARTSRRPMPTSTRPEIAPLVEIERRPLSAGAVPRPHARLQGHRAADAGPAVRPRAEASAAAAPRWWRQRRAIPARRPSPRLGGLPNIEVFVLHPKGRVSEVQRRQMTTAPSRQCPQHRARRQLRRRAGAS